MVLRSPEGETVVRDIAHGRWVDPSGDAETTIGEGSWALPGLADAHAHLASAELNYQPGDPEGAMGRARAALEAGVTLILDKGWSDDVTIQMMRAVPAADRPEVEAAARIIASPGGYFPGFAVEVDQGRLAATVRQEARAGAGWVKLAGDWPRRGIGPVANFDEEHLRLAVEAAVSVGAKVAIHTMAPDVPSAAVAAGVHSIEHGMFLTDDDLDLLGQRDGMWVPTVLRCEATLAQLGETSSGGKLFLEGLARMRTLLPLAVEAGVHVLTGTDLIGSPADVAAEAVVLGRYGLSNGQVVDAISRAAFAATGRPDSFETGTPADAVLFPENPLHDLEVLRHPSHVIRLGRLL